MKKRIYLIGVPEELSKFLRDSRTMRAIAEVGEGVNLDTVFVPNEDYFKLVGSYCRNRNINTVRVKQGSIVDSALEVFKYSRDNPDKTALGYVEFQARTREMEDILNQMDFYVTRRDLSLLT